MQTPTSVVLLDDRTPSSLAPPPARRSVTADDPSPSGSFAISGRVTCSGFAYSSYPLIVVSAAARPVSREDDAFLRRAILRGGQLVARGRLART